MDRTYDEFIPRVSTGRRLPVERVREIARGRVWTGAQGKALGLVDQLGGLTEAIAKARELANIPETQSVRFKRYPEPQSPWEALSSAFGVSVRGGPGPGRPSAASWPIPQAQAVVSRVADRADARAGGASVLADQPLLVACATTLACEAVGH